MKRTREDGGDAAGVALGTGGSGCSGAQLIDERGPNNFVVKNSPYGADRAKYGWGTLFQPPLSASVGGEYNASIHIGISSLNGVPGKDRAMGVLLGQYKRKFHCLEHCYPYHKVGDPVSWYGWRSMACGKCAAESAVGASPKRGAPTAADTKPSAASAVHSDFIYTIKANNYLTHVRQLDVDAELEEHIDLFFSQRCVGCLGAPHLGPVLVQLPPSFPCNAANKKRIEAVAARIPKGTRIAVELRHRSWFQELTLSPSSSDDGRGESFGALLQRIGWALVVAHSVDGGGETPFYDTGADFMYVRLHGALGRNVGDYGPVWMKRWAERIVDFITYRGCSSAEPGHSAKPREVFFFLNNSDSHVAQLMSSVVDATYLAVALREELQHRTAEPVQHEKVSALAQPPHPSTSTQSAPPQDHTQKGGPATPLKLEEEAVVISESDSEG